MTVKVADTPELVGWPLHFGRRVQVLRPEALREKVLAEARKILRQD
jgi:predicted DNA-binding transcriptional regulator YafY